MLQSTGSQRVRHDLVTEQQQQQQNTYLAFYWNYLDQFQFINEVYLSIKIFSNLLLLIQEIKLTCIYKKDTMPPT